MHPCTTLVLFGKSSLAGKPGVVSTCKRCRAPLVIFPRAVCSLLHALHVLISVSCPSSQLVLLDLEC